MYYILSGRMEVPSGGPLGSDRTIQYPTGCPTQDISGGFQGSVTEQPNKEVSDFIESSK